MEKDSIEYTIKTLFDNSGRDLEDVISDFHYIMKQIDKDQITWGEWCNYDTERLIEKLKNIK